MFKNLSDLELAEAVQQAMGDMMKLRDVIIEIKKEIVARKQAKKAAKDEAPSIPADQ